MDRCAGVALYVRWHHSATGGRQNPSTFPGGKTMYQRLLAARDARRNEDGFTLIELLIVIIVLGILAGIVVFGVGTFRQDPPNSANATNRKVVSTAAEAYNAKTGG